VKTQLVTRQSQHTQGRMAKFESILGTVGNTPVVRINNLAPPGINLFVKIVRWDVGVVLTVVSIFCS
jgi:hypothetical protein